MTSGSLFPKVLPLAFSALLLLGSILLHFNALNRQAPFGYLQWTAWLGAAGALWFFERVLQLLAPGSRIGSRWVFTLLALAFAPAFVRAGLAASGELVALMLLTGAWYFSLQTQEEQRLIYPLAAGAMMALSAFFGTGLVLMVAPLWFWTGFAVPARRRLATLLMLLLGVAGAMLALYWGNAGENTSLIDRIGLADWSPGNLFRRSFEQEGGPSAYFLPNLVYALTVFCHPGLGLGMVGLYFLFKKTDLLLGPKRLLASSIAAYLFFMAGLPEQNLSFLLPGYLLLLWLLFPAWDRFYCYGFLFFPRLTRFLIGLSLAFQLFFGVALIMPMLQQRGLEKSHESIRH